MKQNRFSLNPITVYLENNVDENAPDIHVAADIFGFFTERGVHLYRLLLKQDM